jgi:peptide deformylase
MSTDDNIVLYNTEDVLKIPKPQQEEIETFDLVDLNHPALHKALPEFDFENSPVNPTSFASTLVETCKKNNGLGLSANQCGFEHRVFVMGAGDDFIACFNPKLIETEGEVHLEEGCLSFPLLNLRITRPKTVKVEYQDYNGQVRAATFDGITARCFLHELDHMNGMMYTSRVKPLALQFGIKKLEKIRRKYFNPKVLKQMAKQSNGNQKTNP